nr:hydrolase [uncultured Macellibacteroides sp.]
METTEKPDFECCPPFDPAPWDDKLLIWENKKFIKDKVCTFFYMPLNFGNVIVKLYKKIQEASATVPDGLCLSDHTSRWNMDMYLAVDKEVSTARNITLSGKFYCKVYEGSFIDTAAWCKDYEIELELKGLRKKKMFMWYTTCPKCAKKYGKNYVVIVSEVE